MSPDEGVSATDRETELRRLRERVYGPGAVPDATDIARLHELETSPEEAAGGVSLGADTSESATDVGLSALPVVTPSGARADATPDRTRPGRRSVALIAASLALPIALAGAIGFILGSASRQEEGQRFYPELAGGQSAMDIVPEQVVTDFDAESARFVAAVKNLRVFAAAPASYAGICLVVEEESAQSVTWTIGCSARDAPNSPLSVASTDGTVFSIGESPGSHEGEPLRLSENITAYIPERGSPGS